MSYAYFLGVLPYSSQVLLCVTRTLILLTFLYAVNARHFSVMNLTPSCISQGLKRLRYEMSENILTHNATRTSDVQGKHRLSQPFIVFAPPTIRATHSLCRNVPVFTALFLSKFPTDLCSHLPSFPYIHHAPPPPISSLFNNPYIWLGVEIMQFLIIILYQPPLTSYFFPNILLSPLFSKTLSLCYSINVADHVSDLNKTRDKINVTPPTKCILFKKNPI